MAESQTNRHIRGRTLRSAGYDVIEAANGTDALRIATEEQPSLVLLDIDLPDINGFAVCRRLKSNPKTAAIPVLHISSIDRRDHDYPEALESGAEAYLQEPVEPSTLVAIVGALIRAAAAEARARETEREAVDMLEGIGEAMYLLDQDYRFRYVNAEAERLLGLERPALIGKTHSEVFPESVGTTVDHEYRRVMTERTPSSFENFYEPWRKWYEVKATPVSEGGIAVHFRDITSRKESEEERLRLVRELTQRTAALEAAALFPQQNPAPVLRVSTDGVLQYANPSSAPLLAEWKCEVGQTTPDFVRRAVQKALAQGAPAEFEFRLLGRDYSFIVAPIAGRSYADLYGRDVTERKRLANQLRERIEELEAVMEVAPVAIWVSHDSECRSIIGNRMADEFYEAAAGENVSANISAVRRFFQGGRELQARELPMQEAAARNTDLRNSELDVLLPSGRLMHMLGNACPLRDAAGQVRGCVGAFLDITERRHAEQALRESEERFRSLADGCPAVIWVSDAEGNARFVNRAYREFFGVTYEQVEGMKWRPLIHPDDEPEYVEAFLRGVRERAPVRAEARARRADGQWRWIATYAEPRFSAGGEFLGHGGVSPDITERKQAEQALAEAVQRLNAHMDNSPLAVIEFDPQFRVTRWSKEAERVFGWSGEEVLGRTIEEMRWVHEDDVEAVRRISEEMLRGTQPRNMHVNRNYRKDGSVVECEWYNSAIYDGQGTLTSILAQALDITDRKRTEERLRQAQKMESIALLAGGVAHDFNNLLVGVIGNASLALEMLPPESPAEELLHRIVKSGEQAAHLTKQMLAYSGKGRFVIEPVDLSDVVREVTDLVRATAPKKIALQLDFEPEIPPIEADRSQIHQVLMNLVINAAEAIGNEQGLIAIQTGIRRVDDKFIQELAGWDIQPGNYVFLEVRDTGSGMDEAVKAKIFDPFFTTKFQGRGLGLAAVAGIVRGHKGAIRVRSAPGRGASFLLLFPAMDSGRAARAATDRTSAAQEFKAAGPILVVDDEETVRDVVKHSLERRGCEVLLAGSASEALDVLRHHADTVSLIILDLSMPDMSGREVLPKLLEINPRVDVVVSSGYAAPDALRLFQGMPVAGFIQKPYTAQRVVEIVRQIFDRKQK